jgi:hypothetical protein
MTVTAAPSSSSPIMLDTPKSLLLPLFTLVTALQGSLSISSSSYCYTKTDCGFVSSATNLGTTYDKKVGG